jgi:hypothetical protein
VQLIRGCPTTQDIESYFNCHRFKGPKCILRVADAKIRPGACYTSFQNDYITVRMLGQCIVQYPGYILCREMSAWNAVFK